LSLYAAVGYAIAVILFAIVYRYFRTRRAQRDLDKYK
jgi:hypothetical protein